MTRNELARIAHERSVAKGFWDKPLSVNHYLMMVITELAEAVEAHRNGRHASWHDYESFGMDREAFHLYIKDTVEDKMADAAIRLFDLAGYLGSDLDSMAGSYDYEAAVPSFTESMLGTVRFLMYSADGDGCGACLAVAAERLFGYSESIGIDLQRHIDEKMRYNAARPRLHGKKY